MKKEFDKFKQWLKANYNDGLLDLNPPATEDEIAELYIRKLLKEGDVLKAILENEKVKIINV